MARRSERVVQSDLLDAFRSFPQLPGRGEQTNFQQMFRRRTVQVPSKKSPALSLSDPRRGGQISDSDPASAVQLGKAAHRSDMFIGRLLRQFPPSSGIRNEPQQFCIQKGGKECASPFPVPLIECAHVPQKRSLIQAEAEKRIVQQFRGIPQKRMFRPGMQNQMGTGIASVGKTERVEFADFQQAPVARFQLLCSAFRLHAEFSGDDEKAEMIRHSARCHKPRSAVFPPGDRKHRQRIPCRQNRKLFGNSRQTLLLGNQIFISELIHDRNLPFYPVF